MPDRPPMDLGALSLRERERGLLIGGTGSGKSTLADVLGDDWDRRYARRGGRRLIVDSKPRYRAEWTARGVAAAPRYRKWSRGQAVPGSVVVDTPDQLDLAWRLGHRVAIVQGEGAGDIARLVQTVRAFYNQSTGGRPQLVQIDEGLDFFHGNGSPRGGDDVIAQIARAGRERGVAALFGSQRTHGFPATLLSEVQKLYAFRLDYVKDARRFGEFGCPEFPIPEEKHTFRYWTKDDYRRVWGPYRLTLPGAGR